jgi:hypothetical protein
MTRDMKMKILFNCLIIGMAIFLVSCEEDGPTPEPTIEFLTGDNYVGSDTTLYVNSNFTIGITAESMSEKNITQVSLIRKLDNGTPVLIADTATSSHSVNLHWNVTANATPGFYEEFTCEVSDANHMASSTSLTVYTVAADPGIIYRKNIILTSFNIDLDHFFSTTNGYVYDISDCSNPNIQELIDLAYYDNVTTGHTFMSPDVEFLQTIYPSVADWTHKNITRFSKTEITAGAFDAIETIDEFNNAMENAVEHFDLKFVDNVDEGIQYGGEFAIAFKNKEGIRGLLKVIGVQSSPNFGESIITFDMKIEKDIE